ncbi:MAG: hypothetical protein EBZ05_08465 [Verrucomicrobia bacterium]|nr:hypothetical protein [Verrucomicrobiota bacterium]NDA26851.1 hypothetical protein [Verrucomicrobiota bacterium]
MAKPFLEIKMKMKMKGGGNMWLGRAFSLLAASFDGVISKFNEAGWDSPPYPTAIYSDTIISWRF